MPDLQVPEDAIQEARLFCKTQLHTKPNRQQYKPSHRLKLMKFLWRFVKLYFLCPLSCVSFWFLSVLFCFVSVLRLCFVLSTLLLLLPPFLWVSRAIHVHSIICPALNFLPFFFCIFFLRALRAVC